MGIVSWKSASPSSLEAVFNNNGARTAGRMAGWLSSKTARSARSSLFSAARDDGPTEWMGKSRPRDADEGGREEA